MSAPGQDAAQPGGTAPDGQGQGQDRTDSYQSILGEDAFSDAPEELREHLTNYVRSRVDPALTQRFQEASEFRKTWEPYSQVEGLTDLQPEEVNGLLDFFDLALAAQQEFDAGNPGERFQEFSQWWEQVGDQFNLFDSGEESEGDEGEGDEPEYMTREEFEAELAQRDQQREQQSSMQAAVEQNRQEIKAEVTKLTLPGDPGSPEREKAENAVYTFMQRYTEDTNLTNAQMVQAAYKDYSDLVGGAQSSLLEEHEEPGEVVTGGRGDHEPEQISSWADADRAAKARLTGANR